MFCPITITNAEDKINAVIKSKQHNDLFVIFCLNNFFKWYNYPAELVQTIFFMFYQAVTISCGTTYTIVRTNKMHVFGDERIISRYMNSKFENQDPNLYHKQIFFRGDCVIVLGANNVVHIMHFVFGSTTNIIKIAENIKYIDILKSKYKLYMITTDNMIYEVDYAMVYAYGTINLDSCCKLLCSDTIDSISCSDTNVLCLTTKHKIVTGGSFGIRSPNFGILSNVVRVFNGQYQSYFLTKDGKIYGNVYDRYDIREIMFSEPITDIQCGAQHTLALTTNGNVYVWGKNIFEKLGIKAYVIYQPHKLEIQNIVSIHCGNYHAVLLSKYGKAYYFRGIRITNFNDSLKSVINFMYDVTNI